MVDRVLRCETIVNCALYGAVGDEVIDCVAGRE